MTKKFKMNEKSYKTDSETLEVLRDIVKAYKQDGSKDASAVEAIMHLGLATGRIVEV